ncbi:hypothetical protein AMAG_13826 [Allomyces macrogynus ATCC 38327]|uniref:C2H2-type domain-containing protein n=1 Tax=Allomyces macrogynus (strain ATCC 38327) TaxID=578462 RepID=A0A0L0T2K5_ALLM3|nr:hypothetical protein AMAG_13826 [Allomyces macrogynus ATCC 38327]|eukprot:KNE68952.1 hypothetical protein AMAG_13826 [Allomyces macrogynus ATCC 38327]
MSDVSFRRTWGKDGRPTGAAAESTSSVPAKRPAPAEPTAPGLLEARKAKIRFDAVVGKTQMVQAGSAAGGVQAGFYCSLCDRLCKDNVAFLDHLNSPMHQKNAGKRLEVKRATVKDVRARILYHKRLRGITKEEYNLAKQVALQKLREEEERRRRKAAKRERQLQSTAGRRALKLGYTSPTKEGEGADEDDDADLSSEYSDYEIDEAGNIIDTPKKEKKPKIKAKTEPSSEPQLAEEEPDAFAEMMGFAGFGGTKK